jgi:hypothetical protein
MMDTACFLKGVRHIIVPGTSGIQNCACWKWLRIVTPGNNQVRFKALWVNEASLIQGLVWSWPWVEVLNGLASRATERWQVRYLCTVNLVGCFSATLHPHLAWTTPRWFNNHTNMHCEPDTSILTTLTTYPFPAIAGDPGLPGDVYFLTSLTSERGEWLGVYESWTCVWCGSDSCNHTRDIGFFDWYIERHKGNVRNVGL